jgi:nitrite reductase/ring-hydroxylating ferredoxin subunit
VTAGFPYETFPTGWFQVLWADELGPGQVLPLRYFDQDLVAYRTDDGRPVVFDAYCVHLGAHLGWGGRVEGECIRCPFHGWLYNDEGANVEIPYADRPNKAQRLRRWEVREINGWILVWHDVAGRTPLWEPPALPEHSSPTHRLSSQLRQVDRGVRLVPQMIVENLVDGAHQQWVHKGSQPADIYKYEEDGPLFRVYNRMVMGAGKGTTWLTPEGQYIAELHTECWGMGIAVARFVDQDGAVHIQAVTPVDHETADLWGSVIARAEDVADDGAPSEMALTRFRFEMKQLHRDLVIWEHMRYVARAPFAGPEARPYGAFRRWANQFYPGASADQ